ncbi:hypothetical protein TrST_g10270 [Triparma strigata]|uniref:Uncharacterized protein n=1 Tax=Triparma strigata TaxID=1606541 RepID=A0A9W6ZXW4_9STRA|nr:hypothetical protein TrST_g10270 [Triparma strigata]
MTTNPNSPGTPHRTLEGFFRDSPKKGAKIAAGEVPHFSYELDTSQLPKQLFTALCIQSIFFAGSLSWFSDGLPSFIGESSDHTPVLAGHLPKSFLAAGSHTSSFTVGCFVAVFLRACLPKDFRITKSAVISTFSVLTVMYFLVCFLWFSAIVPKIFNSLAAIFPDSTLYYNDVRRYDVVSTNDIDHSLVASGSDTLSWLLGMIVLAFNKEIISKRALQRLVAFTTFFAVVTTGTRMQPTFICFTVSACAVLLMMLRNHSAVTKLNALMAVCVTVAAASSLTKISAQYDIEGKFQQAVNWYVQNAMEPNLPFCEQPFAASPWMAQGASAMAHLPFFQSIILALAYFSPTVLPTLDENNTSHGGKKDAVALKRLLWTQWALQFYTSVGGHMLPNPRMIANQEFSISLAFAFLFQLVKFTTDERYNLLDWKIAAAITGFLITLFLTVGLMPVIFLGFFCAVIIGTMFEGAFGRFTPYASKVLLGLFVPTALILAVESLGCDYLQTNVSASAPWHFAFDIALWQVVGSALDLVLITPAPGPFLTKRESHVDSDAVTADAGTVK